MLSVYPNYLRETVTLSVLSAAAFSPFARSVLSLTGSPFSDRWGRGRVLLVSFGVSALGVGIAVAYPSGWSASVAALMLGLQGGLVPPIATALIGDVTQPEERPAALGAVFFWRDLGVVMVFGVSILRASTGFTVDARTLMGAFAVLYAACAVISALLVRGQNR
jgi:MFS family permease